MSKVVSLKKTESVTAKMTAFRALDLLQVLRTIQAGNKSLTETVARWIFKNTKKLTRVMELHQPKEDAIVEAYAEKQGKQVLFWDGYEEPVKQNVGGEEKVMFGKRAVIDEEKGILVDIATGEKIERPQMFAPYVTPKEKREEYLTKKRELNAGNYEINLEKINPDLLTNVNIPSPPPNMQQGYDVLDFFYETLVDVQLDLDEDVVDLNPQETEPKPETENVSSQEN